MDQEILTCLKIISMIREGQKLSVYNGVLRLEQSPKGVVAAIRRWLNSDSRHVTLTYIQNILLNGLVKKVPRKYMEESLQGLNALKVTYSEDVTVVARLTVLEEKVQEYIINGENSKELR
jgi:hypothetical protein